MTSLKGRALASPHLVRAVAFAILFSAVVNVLMLTGPLYMLQVYDRVLASGSVPTLVVLTLIVAVLYAFMAVLDWIRARLLTRIARTWDEESAPQLFKAILTQGRNLPPAARIYPPLRDIDAVRNFLAGSGPLAIFDLPWVAVNIGVIFLLHSTLGWFAVFATLILLGLMLGAQRTTQRRQWEAIGCQEAAHTIEQEARSQADYVKALALHEGLAQRWSDYHAKALDLQGLAADSGSLFSALTKSSRHLFQSGILAVGAWLAINQEISAGTIIAAGIILGRGLAPVEQLLTHWRSLTGAVAAWNRLEQLSGFLEEPRPKTSLPVPQGSLELKRLSCFVQGRAQPVVADVNFRLQPGEVMGLIGPSGAGKTTLLKAILGLWSQTNGEVRIDGATLDQWDATKLAGHIGYVPQEFTLLTGTVAENIARFKGGATSQDIIAAAKLAHAHDIIVGLPFGYDTVVGPRGLSISAGQRQRIALACAFYGNPRLIVLDEPNSNLDDAGDQALASAIRAMRQTGAIIIVATHRPSVLAETDKVLVLNQGAQVAFGPKGKAEYGAASGMRFSVLQGGAEA